MKQHNLKTVNPHFEHVVNDVKTFEVRKNDRNFQVGDTLILMEYEPPTKHKLAEYTGRQIRVEVTHLINSYEYCKDGFVIMSIKKLD